MNTSPYGNLIASLPHAVSWITDPPTTLRSSQPFRLSGVLIDIFNQSVTSAGQLFSIMASVSPSQFSLDGTLSVFPRDSDANVQLSDLRVIVNSIVRLPSQAIVTVRTRPSSFNRQYLIDILECNGDYSQIVLDSTLICLFRVDISSWILYLFGTLSIVASIVLFVMGLLVFFRWANAQHRTMLVYPSLLAAVMFGSLLILISILTWTELSDSLCAARLWLAVVGVSLLVMAVLTISTLPLLAQESMVNDARHWLTVAGACLITLVPNIIVLIVWQVQDPFFQISEIDMLAGTVKTYCTCNDPVYIWVVLGFCLAGLFLATAISTHGRYYVSFKLRESKHYTYSLIATLSVAVVMIAVAASFWDDIDTAGIVVLIGLIVIGTLPWYGLMIIRIHRVFYPLEGKRLDQKIEFLTSENVSRNFQLQYKTQRSTHSRKSSGNNTNPQTRSV